MAQHIDNPVKGRRRVGPLVFFILLTGFIVFLNKHEAVDTIDCTAEVLATNPEIIMLGAWWCTYCYQAKQYFQKNHIHYCEYDMENTETGRRLYEAHGGGAVPLLLIGDYTLRGFDPEAVESALTLSRRSEPPRPTH